MELMRGEGVVGWVGLGWVGLGWVGLGWLGVVDGLCVGVWLGGLGGLVGVVVVVRTCA